MFGQWCPEKFCNTPARFSVSETAHSTRARGSRLSVFSQTQPLPPCVGRNELLPPLKGRPFHPSRKDHLGQTL